MSIETWSVVYCDECGDPTGDIGKTPGAAREKAANFGWTFIHSRHRENLGYEPMDFCPACWEKRRGKTNEH